MRRIKLLITVALLIGFVIPLFAQQSLDWDNVDNEVKNSNAFKRFEWFYRSRLNSSGVFPKSFIEEQKVEELGKVRTIFRKGNKLQTTSDVWTNIGPKAIDMTASFIPQWGSVSGRIRGIAVHPTDPNIVYIGAASGGIWKTVNGGTNWTDMSGDLNLLTFGAIAIDPNNTNIVYAGTGESQASFNTTTFEGNGLYKSTDGGVSWTQIISGFGNQTQFGDIEVSPHNSNIILAALGSGNWNLGSLTNEGVWRSTDAGITWTRVINSDNAFDVGFDPTTASTRAYCATGVGGFFVSTNSGATWTPSNTGLPTATSINRIQFSVSQSSPSTIYSVINGALAPMKTVAYKSTNSGASWIQISSGVNIAGSYNGTSVSDQGGYDLCIDVSPTDPDNVFFGNVELSSTANGTNIAFVRKTPPIFATAGAWDGYTHTDIHKIVYAPSNANIIYVGCDGGIFKSTNGGTSFTHINNDINTIQFYRIGSDPGDIKKIYGGAQDNGNFSTFDRGATDWVFETSGDGMECFVDRTNSSRIFMSTQFGSLIKSEDGGGSWVTTKTSDPNYTAWVAPYWQHPTSPAIIFAGYDQRIIKSTDNGSTWTNLTGYLTSGGQKLTSIAQSAVTTNNMMAVASNFTTTPELYTSADEGATWTADIAGNIATSGFTPTFIQKVIADPSNGNTFYLCRISYGSGQVLKTTDFGVTWTDISGNLPKIAHNTIFIDPANTNHLYVANDFGVYWTNNGGTEWNRLSNGMPFVPVLDFDFYVSGTTRLLRAASHGRGVFELQIDTPLQKVYVDLKVFLEGPYAGPQMSTTINGSVPSAQPFNTPPWSYAGTETASIGSDIVDWVLVELRTGTTPSTATTVVSRKAALVKKNGSIVDADGFTNVNFNVAAGNYYIVIFHRNHLPIMTPTAITLN